MKEIIAEINKKGKRIKEKREKNQINKTRNEKIMRQQKIQNIIRDYYEQLCANKMENLEEMEKFLEKYNFLKLNQE